MRTTLDITPETHESVRRLAQRQGVSMSRLLGLLVERGLQAQDEKQALPTARSGRFQVIAAEPGQARVTQQCIQKVIDEEGIL